MVFLDIFAKCDGNSVSSATTAMEDESLEVNYDQNPTKLYKLIEAQRWSPVLAEIAHNPDSTKVWVVRHDKKDNDNTGSIRWRMLPLHAAVVFNAPDPVMCMLIDAYPDAARQFDDRRMTPLHLAFRNSFSESIINKLISSYPNGLYSKDSKGRMPVNLIQLTSDGDMKEDNNFMRKYLCHLAMEIKEKDEKLCELENEVSNESYSSSTKEEAGTTANNSSTTGVDKVDETIRLQNIIMEMKKEIKTYESSLQQSRKENESIKEELRLKNKSIVNESSHKDEMKRNLKTLEKDNQELRSKISDMEKVLTKTAPARKEIEDMVSKMEDLDVMLQKQRAVSTCQIEEKKKLMSELETMKTQKQRVIEDLAVKIGDLNESLQKQKAIALCEMEEKERISAQFNMMKKKENNVVSLQMNYGKVVEVLDETLVKLKSGDCDLEEEAHMKLNSIITHYQNIVKELESEILNAKEKLDSKIATNTVDDKNKSSFQSLASKLERYFASVAEIETELSGIKDLLNASSSSGDNDTASQSSLKERLQKLIDSKESSMKEMQEELADTLNAASTLAEKVKNANINEARQEITNTRLTQEIQMHSIKVEEKQRMLLDMERKLQTTESRLASALKKNMKLSDELNEKNKSIDQMNDSMSILSHRKQYEEELFSSNDDNRFTSSSSIALQNKFRDYPASSSSPMKKLSSTMLVVDPEMKKEVNKTLSPLKSPTSLNSSIRRGYTNNRLDIDAAAVTTTNRDEKQMDSRAALESLSEERRENIRKKVSNIIASI